LPGLVGYHTLTIVGGSMGSALPVGSIAVTRTVDFSDVQVGDIIAFRRAGAELPVVHRVVDIQYSDGVRVALTRGDANSSNDPDRLPLAEGRGDRVVYYVPWIGYALVFIRTPVGIAALAVLGAVTWLLRRKTRSRTQASHRAKQHKASAEVVQRVVEIQESDRSMEAPARSDTHAAPERQMRLIAPGRGRDTGSSVPWVGDVLPLVRTPGSMGALAILAATSWLLSRRHPRTRRTEAHVAPSMAR
jgi:signal peptidase I